jgi:tRNA modification GTPase
LNFATLNAPTTHFCFLTPPGRAAIATISIRGLDAIALVSGLFRPASGKPLTTFGIGRAIFGRFETAATTSEDLVVGLLAPDELEIHCHGGRAAVEAIGEALVAAGAAQLTPAAWTHQQQSDPIAADALLALAEARTERTAAILLDQYRGALRHELTEIDKALAKNDQAAAANALNQLLVRAGLGLHFTNPWKVVITGRPNAGKSSLMNALLGYQRSIVFHEPGTTRDVLTATTAIDGWPIELADTAGLRGESEAPAEPIESEGIARAYSQITSADLVILVADTTASWDESLYQEVSRAACRPPLIVHNKSDLVPPSADLRTGIPTSAVTSLGLDGLCRAIATALIPLPPSPGTAVPFTINQITALRAIAAHLKSGQLTAARQDLRGLRRESK